MAETHPPFTSARAKGAPRTAPAVVTAFCRSAIACTSLAAGVGYVLTGQFVSASAVMGYLIGVSLVLILLLRGFPHPSLGACNVVTLVRLALTAGLLAPLASPVIWPWAVFGVAVLALSLDGVDGWLARRAGRASDFGARFDMEVDSALALILALNAWAAGVIGPWVLLIGLPRYAFIAAAAMLPWLNRALPERFSRKAVCVVQIAALIVLQLPVLPHVVALALVGAVALALIWSFGRDVGWLWRHRE